MTYLGGATTPWAAGAKPPPQALSPKGRSNAKYVSLNTQRRVAKRGLAASMHAWPTLALRLLYAKIETHCCIKLALLHRYW